MKKKPKPESENLSKVYNLDVDIVPTATEQAYLDNGDVKFGLEDTAHSLAASLENIGKSQQQALSTVCAANRIERFIGRQDSIYKNLIESTERAAKLSTQLVGAFNKASSFQESLSAVSTRLNDMNSLSISLGSAFTESQERILTQLSGALATDYSKSMTKTTVEELLKEEFDRIELPIEPTLSGYENEYLTTLRLEGFKPNHKDYSIHTSLSTITSQEPFIYERLDSIEMKVETVRDEQRQADAKTHSKIRTLMTTVEQQGEMLSELAIYVKKHQTNTFSLKDIQYNSQIARLYINNEVTSVNGQNQDTLCRILFDRKRKISEPLSMDELVEYFAGTDFYSMADNDRKKTIRRICDAGYNLNTKIARSTKVKTLLIVSNKQIFINPNLFE